MRLRRRAGRLIEASAELRSRPSPFGEQLLWKHLGDLYGRARSIVHRDRLAVFHRLSEFRELHLQPALAGTLLDLRERHPEELLARIDEVDPAILQARMQRVL